MSPKRKKAQESPVEKTNKSSPQKGPMPRTLWKGTISFGLINIPVRLYAALKTKTVHFHLIHEKDKSRIQQKTFCLAEQKEIPKSELVKGYEVSEDRHVIIQEKELESVAPKASRTIELVQFVDLKQIDPLFYDRPYYLLPEDVSKKAYFLLLETLEKSNKVGIGKFVMHKKEYLAALRPLGTVLYLNTMHFADEIISAHEVHGLSGKVSAGSSEIKMAEQLVESLTDDFDPDKFKDEYREAVMDLVERKVEGKKVFPAPGAEEPEAEVVDLMTALKASLEQNKKKKRKAA